MEQSDFKLTVDRSEETDFCIHEGDDLGWLGFSSQEITAAKRKVTQGRGKLICGVAGVSMRRLNFSVINWSFHTCFHDNIQPTMHHTESLFRKS